MNRLRLLSLSVLVLLMVSTPFGKPNKKYTCRFKKSEESKYEISNKKRLKYRKNRLNLLGGACDGTKPYVQLRAQQAKRFLKAKKLKHFGRNVAGLRYCVSRDSGNTWWYIDADTNPRKWVTSNGKYEQSTGYGLCRAQFKYFKRRMFKELKKTQGNRRKWKEALAVRIFFKCHAGYDKDTTDVDNDDDDIVSLDSIEIEVDDNREVDDVIISTIPDTVIDTIEIPVVRVDTVVKTKLVTDTVEVTVRDTVLRVDTAVIRDTTVVYEDVIQLDTIIQIDTVIKDVKYVIRDTVRIFETQMDTLVVQQTDTVRFTDTVTALQIDTVREKVTVTDTVTVTKTLTDTVIVENTITKLDTVIIEQEVVIHDTVEIEGAPVEITKTVTVTDTVVETDTVTLVDTIQGSVDTVVVRDTVTETVVRVDTVYEEVKPYPDYNADCDTCRPVCGGPIEIEAGDSAVLNAHAFNDSGEYLGTLPWPEEDECPDGVCPQALAPTKVLDSLVQVGPWYYHLIVKPNVMIGINIYVMVEGNLIELRNFKTHPGDTLVLVAVGVDSFGNQIGEVDVDWFATGDSADPGPGGGIGAFLGGKKGTRTTIVAGPELGQLGIRWGTDTIMTADSVSIETIIMTFPAAFVEVRDSAGGKGTAYGGNIKSSYPRLETKVNDTINLFVAAYDSNGDYITDLAVWWDGGGVVKDHIQLAFDNSLLVTPEQSGAGSLKMTYKSGETGKITVIVEVNVSVATAYRLEIRTGPNGTGELLDSLEDDVITSIGQIIDLYASAVDEDGNHIVDTVVEWSAQATVNTKLWTYNSDHMRLHADSIEKYLIVVEDTAGGMQPGRTDTAGIQLLGKVDTLKIRTAAGGEGRVLTNVDSALTADNILQLYAAGYDSTGAYLGDFSANWLSTDTNQSVTTRVGESWYYAPTKPGIGKIKVWITLGDTANPDTVSDMTGTISVAVGAPAKVVFLEEPASIALDATYQFSAIITDWAGNQIVGALAWSLDGSVGTMSATGKLTATQEGTGRAIASYGALADTTGYFAVNDGEMLTDAGGTFTFADEGVVVTIPAQAGLNGNVLDVDLQSSPVLIDDFVKVRGPFSFQQTSKKTFAEAITVDFKYVNGYLDTIVALGRNKSDIRLYRYNQSKDEWNIAYEATNDTAASKMTLVANSLNEFYMMGVDMKAPVISFITVPDTVNDGNNVRVEIGISDNIPNCVAYVYYRQGSDSVGEIDTLNFTAKTDTVVKTIYGDMVDASGISIQVSVTDGLGLTKSGQGGEGDAVLGPAINVTNQIYPGGLTENEWVVFSLPVDPATTRPADFFRAYGVYQTHWTLASVQNNGLEAYDSTTENFAMEAGKVYWFATGAQGAILRVTEGTTFPASDTFKVKVPAGHWVAFGLPFKFSVTVADIRKATGADTANMAGFVYYDNDKEGNWEMTVDTLHPWGAYYVNNQGADTLTVKIPPLQAEPEENPPAKMFAANGEWCMGVRACAKGSSDGQKVFGRVVDKDGDLYSIPHMPVWLTRHKGPLLAFERDSRAQYFSDFRNFGKAGGDTWRARVTNPHGAKGISLAFEALTENRKPEAIAVVDKGRGGVYFDVTESMEYNFVSPENAEREIFVVAGSKAYVQSKVAHLRPVPKEFALMQNMPNPFNPVTSIRFMVPQLKGSVDLPGAEMASLKIYNLRGQAVGTLFHGPIQAGYYTMNWNGKDHAGRPCASGTYIYRMHVGGSFSKSLRMTLVK